MAKPRDRYVDFLIEQFAPLGEITSRAMFGGYCLYCDGIVFGLVANSELYLKAEGESVARYGARGLKAFQPFDDPQQTMRYYQAPPEIFEDVGAMQDWVGEAVECGRMAKRSGSKKKKPRSKAAKP